MCLYNAVATKADFKVKKFWKTFYLESGKILSVVFMKEYKVGWNYPDPKIYNLQEAGIHCFNNYDDAKTYKNCWCVSRELICPVYALGSDIIAVGETTVHPFSSLNGPSTTFRKVFIRQKDYEKILKGESVHD
jgi:hypothetical protein